MQILASVLAAAALAAGLVPAGTSSAPPVCDGDVPALAEGEQYAERTLYLDHADPVAELGLATGSSGTMGQARPVDELPSVDVMAGGADAPLGDPSAASWTYQMPQPERVVCWQLEWHEVGGQPATVTLWGDEDDAALATAQVAGGEPNGVRTMAPSSLDAEVQDRLAVQVGADAGAVLFGSLDQPSALTYVVIEPAPPEPDVLVVDIDFEPGELVVAVGETVDWAWQGSIPHDVRADGCADGPDDPECYFDSGIRTATPDLGTRFAHTFTEPGVYSYYCSVHSTPGGTAHNGVIIVE